MVAVEGRTNDVLSFEDADHQSADPAVGPRVGDRGNPGVHRFQAIGTGSRGLTVRLDVDKGRPGSEVEREVERRVREFLGSQGVTDVTITCTSEAPRQEPRSGKLRQVLRA